MEGNPYIIPGGREGEHLVNLRDPWERIRERAQLEAVRLHDLRHSYGAAGALAGIPLRVLGAVLGHTQAATTQRYAHVADDPRKQAGD